MDLTRKSSEDSVIDVTVNLKFVKQSIRYEPQSYTINMCIYCTTLLLSLKYVSDFHKAYELFNKMLTYKDLLRAGIKHHR